MDVPKLLLEVGPPAGWGRTGARDLSIAERKALLAAWSSMSAEERNALVRDFNTHHEKQAQDRRAGREAEHEHAQYPRNIGMGAVRGILGGTAGGAIAAPLMVDGRVTSAKALLHAAGKKAVIGASTGAVLGTIYEAGKAQGRAEEIKKSGINKRLHPIDLTVAKGTKAVLGPGMKDTVMRGAVAGLLGGAGYSGYHSPAAGGWKGRVLLAAHGGGIGAMKGALTGVGVGAIRGLGDKAGKNEEVMDRLVQQSQKGHRKHGSALTPADIHALADRLGVKWDNDTTFMNNCERWTGKRHLDDMDERELRLVTEGLRGTAKVASTMNAPTSGLKTAAEDKHTENIRKLLADFRKKSEKAGYPNHFAVVEHPDGGQGASTYQAKDSPGGPARTTRAAMIAWEKKHGFDPHHDSRLEKRAEVEYRGKTFPGYNKPIASDKKEKKMMVLAKKGDEAKLIHFGQKGYQHNYSPEAKQNYLTRSAGIRNKSGQLTKDDPFSPNYWARKVLWPKGKTGDGQNGPINTGVRVSSEKRGAATPEAMALFHRAQETQKKMLPVLHREREKLDKKFGETFEPFSSVHSGINLPDEGASDIDLNVGVHDVHAFSKRLDKAGIPYVKSRDNTRVHTYTTPEGYDVELKVRPKVEVDYQIPGRDRVNALSDHEKAEFIHEKWKAKNSGDPKQYADVKYKLYERYGMIPPGGDWNSLTKKAGVLTAFA